MAPPEPKREPTGLAVTHPETPPAHIGHVSTRDKPQLTLITGGTDAALEADYRRCRQQVDAALSAMDESWQRLHAALADRAGTPPALLLTIDQAADYLGMSRSTVNRLIANGTLGVVRLTSSPRIRRADLDRLASGGG